MQITVILGKDIFKVVIFKKVPCSLKVFDSHYINEINSTCTDKANDKSKSVIQAHDNKNLILTKFLKM